MRAAAATSSHYEASHHMTGIEDQRGAESDVVYDSTGHVQSFTDAGGQTQYSHTAAGISITQADGVVCFPIFGDGELLRLDVGNDPVAPLATTLFTYDPATLAPTAVTNP